MELEEQIELIMRQTNYTKETAEQKLKDHTGDILNVIREYMGPSRVIKPCSNMRSVNQQIYKEIRGMMDDASKAHEAKKERVE